MNTIVKIVLCLSIANFCCAQETQQETQQNEQETQTYDNLDARSKRILKDRAQNFYELPEGHILDVSNGIDQWTLFEKNVVVENKVSTQESGGFVRKEVVASRKTLKNSDEVEAHRHLPMVVSFHNNTELTYTRNQLNYLVPTNNNATTANVLFCLKAGKEYWRDTEINLTPSADSRVFSVDMRIYDLPKEISKYAQPIVFAAFVDPSLLLKGQLKPNREYIVRVKYTDDPKNRTEIRSVNGKNLQMYEILPAENFRLAPEKLHDLVVQGKVRLYEWNYTKKKTGNSASTTAYVWTNKIVQLKYNKPRVIEK